MRRREFITLVGGAAAWPLAARAQERIRRIGVLVGADENDPESNRRHSAFIQALADLGWADGRDLRMDLRWGRDDTNRIRALARAMLQAELQATEAGTARLLQLATRIGSRRKPQFTL